MKRERSLNIHKNIVSFSKPMSGNIKVIISHDSTVVEKSEMSTGCIIIVFNVCPCQFVLSLQIPCLKIQISYIFACMDVYRKNTKEKYSMIVCIDLQRMDFLQVSYNRP